MKKPTPTEQVETWLRAERSHNEDKKIWPSHNVVIDRLLNDPVNMKFVYAELLDKIPPGKPFEMTCERFCLFLDFIVRMAAGWNPDATKDVREDIRVVKEKNEEIKKAANKLADLLRERIRICNRSDITSPDDYLPFDLMERAAEIANREAGRTGGVYFDAVKDQVENLESQYDYKYWPTTANLIDALAEAQEFEPEPSGHLMSSALSVGQASVRDFLRAYNAGLSGISRYGAAAHISDAALAALTSCVLGMKEPIEESAIKKFRADERKVNR